MFGPLLFEQLGLTPDPVMPVVMPGGGWDVLSVERLSTLTAEHIFMVIDPDSEIYLSRVTDTPICATSPQSNTAASTVSPPALGSAATASSAAKPLSTMSSPP